MRTKQRLGQNFLMHKATAERIVKSAGLPERATVLEVGAGTGLLTEALLSKGHRVVAVETDADLIPTLTERFGDRKSFSLVHSDIRSFDLKTVSSPYHVVANIPYYITGEIIRTLLEARNKPASVTLLVQKEVAERVARSKKESILSLSVKAFGTPRIVMKVPRGAFSPAPKVDSAVLHVSLFKKPFRSKKEEIAFFTLIHAGFAHKRKLLLKNLEVLYPREIIADAFVEAELPVSSRAEDLSLYDWKKLCGALLG